MLVRDDSGAARAFHNVCRHRGARLVDAASGCRQRFTCPYHAWTYSASGALIGAPHEKNGFPGLDRAQHALHSVPCAEYGGWLWIAPETTEALDPPAYLGALADEFRAIGAERHRVAQCTVREIEANWKIIIEGGLEAYHFRVAHRATIAPLFCDNLSTYRTIDRHLRSVLPRRTLLELPAEPNEDWVLRRHANLLYTVFPASQLLLQEDHFVWIQATPVSPSRTRLRMCTLVPSEELSDQSDAYWQKNHALTMQTLDEDFALGEGIQRGLASGANAHLNFGTFESALTTFNRFVDAGVNDERPKGAAP